MTPESLIRTHQDGVYTVCLHVLGNSHDAEDAAQESLLKIAAGATEVREPRAFKSWLYQVTYRTAVDHLRKRATRRRIEEGSAPMTPSLTEEQREAIHEAMAALPDDDRLVLVEHYFEKIPLSELGRREGISDVAMGKRVDKAREKLKRGLAGAGFLIGSDQVTHALESVVLASAPAIVSNAALTAGGAAMSAKSVGVGILVALLAVGLLVGIGWRFLGRSDPGSGVSQTHPAQASVEASAVISKESQFTTTVAGTSSGAPACRALLVRAAIEIRSNDVQFLAWDIQSVQAGKLPLVEALVREFTSSAGADLVPIARTLIKETRSDTVRFLIAVALGRNRDPGSLELLKSLAAEGESVPIAATALYSIGLHQSQEGFAFLQGSWERWKEAGGPIGLQLVQAVGLQGSAAIPWLQSEFRTGKLDKVLKYEGSPWSFAFSKGDCFAQLRGPGAYQALRQVFESETDPDLRRAAARGMTHSFAEDQVDYLVSIASNAPDFDLKRGVMLSLLSSESPHRSAVADRILEDTPFPSGNAVLDLTLARLSTVASPARAQSFFDRFLRVADSSSEPAFAQYVAFIIGAASTRSDAEARIKSVESSGSFTEEQRRTILTVGLRDASPDAASAFLGPVLSLIQSLDPDSHHFGNGLRGLMNHGVDEVLLSKTLQDASARFPGPQSQFNLMQAVISHTRNPANQRGPVVIPETFLATRAELATDADTVLTAAYCLSLSGSERMSTLRSRVAEWVGRDMKWATATYERTLLPFVAPMVIGDYYVRYGTAEDVDFLRTLSETFTFPTPSGYTDGQRILVKKLLSNECSRAIDAIRLRS